MRQIKPQEGPQEQFLRSSADIVFYGGSAGGGKTYALLLDALYGVGNPNFGAVIFRRTTKQIENEGGLWDTAQELYLPLGFEPNQTKHELKAPGGAKITFSHMEHDKNRFDWQGSQLAYAGYDEITHFSWKQFSYMLSRMRSPHGIKTYVRGTCNPDPDSWVRQWVDWYIDKNGYAIPERSGVIRYFCVVGDEMHWSNDRDELIDQFGDVKVRSFTFIRSSVEDNKLLLEADPDYLANLDALPLVEREQLKSGNWNIRPAAGLFFKRSYFEVVDAAPAGGKSVRAWDLAATKIHDGNKDPDWTVGVKMSKHNGIYYVEHMDRFRCDPPMVEKRIHANATQDGHATVIRMPIDPGAAGKAHAQYLTRSLSGFVVRSVQVTGSKQSRWLPVSSQAEAGNIKIVRGAWNEAFFNELESLGGGKGHDDIGDAFADAHDELADYRRPQAGQGKYRNGR